MFEQELNLTSDEDLIKELTERYSSAVIGLWREHARESKVGVFKLRWIGDSFIASGLCAGIQEQINTDRRAGEEPHSADD